MASKMIDENLIAQVVAKIRAQQETIRMLRAENKQLTEENDQLRRDLEFWRERGMG